MTAVARIDGVARVAPLRATPVQLDPALPPVTLLVRPLAPGVPAGHGAASAGGGQVLPLLAPALTPVATDHPVVAVYVSEALPDLHGVRPGQWWPALAAAFPSGGDTRFFVAGVWRDYARQQGSVVMDRADFLRLGGDPRVSDLAVHLRDDRDEDAVREGILALARQRGAPALITLTSAGELRATSLRIFDRSFAVTYWLQAVAIGIGLFGVAASFSAQVLARRKEFGLLAHLGLTRRQILGLVALEGLAWTALGALAGLALGLAVGVVLVHVVNPQSFHWTMELSLPWPRLLALCAAVVGAGTATAWLAGRAAAGRDAVQAVKEDW
jgi:putative ABC transport system permease protein